MIIITILLLILLILIFYLFIQKIRNISEGFDTDNNNDLRKYLNDENNGIPRNIPQEFKLYKKDILDDKLFSDVIYYMSDNDLDGDWGLDKCMDDCDGICVEFGMTTNAYCFPKDDGLVRSQYKQYLLDNLDNMDDNEPIVSAYDRINTFDNNFTDFNLNNDFNLNDNK